MLAGLDKEIISIFFSLPDETLGPLFSRYAYDYGDSAGAYARATYDKWKAGAVRLSGQTAERLVSLLPQFLPADVKYEFVRKLRDHYRSKLHRRLTTTFDSWKADLLPLVNELVSSSRVDLPSELIKKAEWLSDGDCVVARALLERAEQDEAKDRLSYLQKEFSRLELIVSRVGGAESVQHKIQLPQGSIDVTIAQPKQSFWHWLFGN